MMYMKKTHKDFNTAVSKHLRRKRAMPPAQRRPLTSVFYHRTTVHRHNPREPDASSHCTQAPHKGRSWHGYAGRCRHGTVCEHNTHSISCNHFRWNHAQLKWIIFYRILQPFLDRMFRTGHMIRHGLTSFSAILLSSVSEVTHPCVLCVMWPPNLRTWASGVRKHVLVPTVPELASKTSRADARIVMLMVSSSNHKITLGWK